jgi:hypothetical protein
MSAAPRCLGLDISTYTGWAISEGNKIVASGVRDFSIKNFHHKGKRGIMFYNFLVSLGHIDEIFYESIQFGGGFKGKTGKWVNPTNDGRELYHGFLMLVNMFAAGFGVESTPVHPSTLKKQFAGNGHATKTDMCDAARSHGWKGGTPGSALHDDEADAIALLITQVKSKYGIIVTC